MSIGAIPLAKEIDRVPSSTVPLDHAQELRFQRLMDPLIMVDVHVHPMVLPDDMEQLTCGPQIYRDLLLTSDDVRRCSSTLTSSRAKASGSNSPPIHSSIASCAGCSGSWRASRRLT